jgi:hypothetical protein
MAFLLCGVVLPPCGALLKWGIFDFNSGPQGAGTTQNGIRLFMQINAYGAQNQDQFLVKMSGAKS